MEHKVLELWQVAVGFLGAVLTMVWYTSRKVNKLEELENDMSAVKLTMAAVQKDLGDIKADRKADIVEMQYLRASIDEVKYMVRNGFDNLDKKLDKKADK